MPTGIGYGLLGDLQPDVSGLTDRRGLAANDPETMRLLEEEKRRQMMSLGGLMDQPIPNALNAAGAGMMGSVGDIRELGGLLSQAGPVGPLQQLGQQLGNLPQGAPTSDEAAALSGADLSSPSGILGLAAAPDALGPLAKAGSLASVVPLLAKTAGTMKPKLAARAFSPGKTKKARAKFDEALGNARAQMDPRDAAQVSPVDEDFSGTVYLTDDGNAGFTLTDNGYVGNVFRAPGAEYSGVMEAALIKARAAGAKNLQAFDTYLAKGYKNRGAIETGRSPWDPQYATPEIEAALGDQRPDYVDLDIGGFAPERKHSELAGPREQNPLLRYEPARGEPKRVTEAVRGGRVARARRLAEKGKLTGAEKWYWTGGVKDRFIEAWDGNVDKGSKMFDRFMDYVAGLSPRSKVDANLKRASVLYQRHLEGLSNDPLTNEMFPPGYGHLATRSAHAPAIRRLEETGSIGNPVDQQKITSFAENVKGNFAPMTIDTHNNQLITGRKASPTRAEYTFLERRESEMASRLGLDPAEYQSALWVGGEDLTGVANPQNLTPAINQRIAATAEALDTTEEEAFRMFARGDAYLRAALLSVGTGTLIEQLLATPDDDETL